MIINLYGGPGNGKSTAAAGLFHEMKKRNFKCELVMEYAKDLVYEGRLSDKTDQIAIFMEQYRRTSLVYNSVDFVITDSPLRLSEIYDNTGMPEFKRFVRAVSKKFINYNIILHRDHGYIQDGRIHTEEESSELQTKMYRMLVGEYIFLPSSEVVECVIRMLERRRDEGINYTEYIQY